MGDYVVKTEDNIEVIIEEKQAKVREDLISQYKQLIFNLSDFFNFNTEGCKGETCHFEILLAEGNTDNCNAEGKPCNKVFECHGNARCDCPDYVCKGAENAVICIDNLFIKGHKAEPCKLEALFTKGNTDNGDAPQYTVKTPTQCS